MPPIKHFLLLYNEDERKLERFEEFASGEEAALAYAELEAEYRDKPVQIVLVGADSIDTIRLTHSHYFGGAGDALAPFLSGTRGR